MIEIANFFLATAGGFAAGLLVHRARASVALRAAAAAHAVQQAEATRRLAELEEARAQLSAFVDHMPVYMSLCTLSGQFILGTRKVADAYGTTTAALGAMALEDMLRPWTQVDELLGAVAAVDSSGESQRVTTPFRMPSEPEPRLLEMTVFPIRTPDGRMVQVGAVGIDVTEQRRREEALTSSRAMLQAFADNVPAGLSIKDRDGTFTMVNAFSARAYYGRTPAEVIGRNANSLRTKRHGDHLPLMEQALLETGTVQRRDVTYQGLDGQRHMHLVFFPIKDADGEITHIGSLTHDVTESRKHQEDLVQSQATLQAFFDNLPGLAFLTTNDGRIIAANSFLADEFGITAMRAHDMLGNDIQTLLPHAWAAQLEKATDANERPGKALSFEAEIGTPSGSRHVSSIRFPIRTPDGEVTLAGWLVFDRTAQMRATDELMATREHLHQTEKLAALGQLLAGVSHELNNPLAAVIGQASLLAEDLEGSEHAGRVSKIRRAADRCARIVQSFLAMARRKAPERRRVSMHDLVRQALDLTEYQMRAANVTVEVELDPSLPAVNADPDQLHQVIVNLLTNARQALEDATATRRITLSGSATAGEVTLLVADNGPGIAPSARARIFDPFYTTKLAGSGTGLGLSYSLSIIEAHGGRLALAPANVGTVFAVTLPACDAPDSDIPAEPTALRGSRGRVLVVDDEADVAETLCDMLERAGLQPEVALGGRAAQAALAHDRFDLVISDIRMPEVDGQALHGWITRNRPELARSVAFVTGDTLSERVSEFLARVDCPVLEKPFAREALEEMIDRMMSR